MALTGALSAVSAGDRGLPTWYLPDARDVNLSGPLGDAYARGIDRLKLPPYDSPVYLRSDVSFESNRVFVNYSGDISGRFIQIASLVSPRGKLEPPALPEVLRDLARWQKADGHFGRDVDWSQPLEPENPNARLLPIFWGNSRLLVGLLAAYDALGREDGLDAARRIGDFYVATADRFLDPGREAEYRMTGSYAAGYPTDYFPGIEGLVLLYRATADTRYLRQAERMAGFFQRFDTLPIDHSHGNLITHYGLLLLFEETGQPEYLRRPLAQWQRAVDGGYVWPMGGVGEKFRVSYPRDEGCSEADWLRLNLRLWEFTGEPRFLDMAERLLWNHYAMNRTGNGGYGHHEFACDDTGPFSIKPEFTEAVWCCTFHGLLGLHTFKRYAIVGAPRDVCINFPVSATTTVRTDRGRWRVRVQANESAPGTLQCRVHVEPPDGAAGVPAVRFRRPAWAAQVAIQDARGRSVTVRERNGYLVLPTGTLRECCVTLAGSFRAEDRRLNPVRIDRRKPARQNGVTLWLGPHLLLANTDQVRPTVRATLDSSAHLVFPVDGRLPWVNPNEVPGHVGSPRASPSSTLLLEPWGAAFDKVGATFVFDLIPDPQ